MLLVVIAGFACTPEDTEKAFSYRDPTDQPPLRGPGGPAASFDDEALWQNCASLDGGEEDRDFHNLVMPYRGHLVLPWAAEWGVGGLSFFEMAEPCDPVRVGYGYSATMRETHAIGFAHLPEGEEAAGDWAVVNQARGILFWDIADPAGPVEAAILELENVFWPDAYARVVLSVAWQFPWVYVAAADNGLYVVDARDPTDPVLVGQYSFDVGLRAGGVFALGDTLLVTSAEQSQAALLDISDPTAPQLVAGGLFETTDAAGGSLETYHGNLAGDYALFTRKDDGGGVLVYDVSQRGAPARLGGYDTGDGGGGYVFYDEGYLFLGNTHYGAVFDATDPTAPTLVGTGDLPGDLDTVIPYGNVALLSVDHDAEDGVATVVMPWSPTPDHTPIRVLRIRPGDGQEGVAVTACVGIGFDEPVEPSSIFPGSVRLWTEGGEPVDGWGSAQDTIGSFCPKEALKPGTTYTVEVLAGGAEDLNGNALETTVTTVFRTAG